MGIVLFILVFVLIVVFLPPILVLRHNWKYYKKHYRDLENKSWRKFDNFYYGQSENFEDEFIWFSGHNDFKLDDDVYLHNVFHTFLDPYSHYWIKKYQKWFDENKEDLI